MLHSVLLRIGLERVTMSNTPRPVRLVPLAETPTTDILEALPPEQLEPTPVAAEISGSTLSSLAGYAGELATKAVVKAQDAIDYVKKQGAQVVVRPALATLAVAGLAAGTLMSEKPKEAHAAATYQIVNGPWYIHDSSPTIHSSTIGFAQTGDNLVIMCHETGDSVNGDAEWDWVTDTNNGLTGYIADYGTTTPVHQGQEKAELDALGIPECDGSQQSANQAPAQTPVSDIAPDPGPIVTYGKSIYINFSSEETKTIAHYQEAGYGATALGAYACTKIPSPLIEVPCSIVSIVYGFDLQWAVRNATENNDCLQLAISYAGLNGPTRFGWAPCLD